MSDSEPEIIVRAAQPCVVIGETVPMAELGRVAHRIPELFAWLGGHGIEPAGPPFFKYDVIDMARELTVQVGVAVGSPVPGDGDVVSGTLPGGRYASLTHTGHPDELEAATALLLSWAGERGLRWDMTQTSAGEAWGCRLEFYKSDPATEPDMSRWETELAFRLAD
jgi:effector-binding domain-containing protein